jgi:diadenosine tetraphosphate (Ap4A) HIT family hydrolase
MIEAIKVLLAKKPEDLTDEDKKEIMEAVSAFKKAIEDVCREHGFAYKAILSVTQEGVVPVLDIVQIKEEASA